MTLLSIAAAVVLLGASGLLLRTVWQIDRLAEPQAPVRAQPIAHPIITIERRAA